MHPLLYDTILKGDTTTFLKLIHENLALVKQTTGESLNTVLHLAARLGHLELVSEILYRWPEMVVVENRDMEIALHEACREGHVEVMKVLMAADEGARLVGKMNYKGESVLFLACERGKVEVVKELIEFPWLLVHEFDASICSIHVAAAGGHTEIVKEILKVRPEFAKRYTSEGYTPLHLACSGGHVDTIRELLCFDLGLLYLRDHNGWTPLHWASMKGRVGTIAEIISTSLESVEMVTNNGETIIHLAVKYNQYDGLRYLIESINIQELVNRQDSHGNTVLHIAVAGKLAMMVTCLLKHGADVNAINHKGYTPLDVVESDGSNSGLLQIVPALLDAGAKRCDQLPPRSRDIEEVVSRLNPISNSPGNRKMESPVRYYQQRKKTTHRRSKQIELQNEGLRNARNTITIVAVLIATVTFQAGINPPGGFSQETGEAIMGRKPSFKVFIVCNIMALFMSLGIVNVLVSVIPFRRKSMMKLLVATHKIMWVSTMFMASAYIAASWTILQQGPGSRWLMIGVMVVGVASTLVVLLGLGVLLAKQWSRKQEWRRRKEKKMKDGTPNSSINSRVGEMPFINNSHQPSSNSDIDSSDHGYHVY